MSDKLREAAKAFLDALDAEAAAEESWHNASENMSAENRREYRKVYENAMVRAMTASTTLRAALAADEMSAWQPIETAPSGEKGIAWMRLAWGEGEDQCTGDGYRQGDQFFACAWFYQLMQPKQFASHDVLVNPTHWMPHDAPPALAAHDKEPQP